MSLPEIHPETNDMQLGVEISIFIHRILDQLSKYNAILRQYTVKSPDELEKKIYRKEFPEHPSYEDYLSALSFQQNALDYYDNLMEKIEVLRQRVITQ